MKNVLRTLIFDGQVSLTLADTTEIVREGIKRHGLSRASAYVFGKALSAMTFASACLKDERGEISLAVRSDGACGDIGVSGNRNLYIRGYISDTRAAGGADCATERACLGKNGSLTIVRDDGYKRPFVGSCALPENGGIDEAFEEYYRISEQLPTRIGTAVRFDGGECSFAGVAALQPLPFADEGTLERTRNISLDGLLAEVKAAGVEVAAQKAFGKDERVWETRSATYKCNCSREYLSSVLVSLGEEQMRQIVREDGAVRVHCHYCNTDYEFTEEDADKLFPRA